MADRSVVYRLRAEVGQFQAQMRAAAASTKDAADKMTAASREGEKFRSGLDTVAGAAGKVGLVAAAGLGAAITKAANFEQAMSFVQAATQETTGNMEKLREAALQAGADTAFSATEAAAGIEELSKAGIATEDILAGGLAGALDLAAAGGISVAEAAETAASAMTQFGLGGEDVTHIADLLAAGAGKAQGSVSDLGAALGQSGLVASQVGLSIEETTGALAAFASAGLVGSDAGTSFKTFLQALTPASKEAANAMAGMGFSAYDADGNFKGLAEVAGDLREGLSTMSVEQQNATLKTIFGADAVRAASIIYEQGSDGIQSWIDKTNDSGFAAETAATRLDNLKGDLEALGGALETALIGTGDGSLGPLRSLTQSITDLVNAYNDLPGPVKAGVGALAGFTAVLGGGAFVFSKVVGGIASTRQAMDDLGISARNTSADVETTDRSLGKMAGRAAGIAAVAGAVSFMASEIGRIDSANLDRSLEALTRGDTTETVEQVVTSIKNVNAALNAVDLGELVTGFGILGDTTLDKYAKNIDQVDQSLAQLVESGNEVEAADIFDRISGLAEEAGVSTEDTAKSFDAYSLALENASESAESSEEATSSNSDAMERASAAAALTGEQFAAAQKAMQEQEKAATNTANSFFDLGDSLSKSKVSLGDWITEMQESAEALRNFRQNSERAADRGLRKGLIAALQEAGPEGALRMKQLANATKAEIDRANEAWASGQREINKYVEATTKTPKSLGTTIKVDGVPQAITNVDRIRNAIAQVKDKTVTIRVTQSGTAARTPGFGPQENAAGGYITGPGTATSDSIPSYLSNGEYVIKAAAVARYGVGMFDRLNAMRFATGGRVDSRKRRPDLIRDTEIGVTTDPLPMLTSSFNQLTSLVRQSSESLGALTFSSEQAESALESQTTALENARTAQQQVNAAMESLGDAVAGRFTSDIFSQQSLGPGVYSAGSLGAASGDPFAALASDSASIREQLGLISSLQGAGIQGSALESVLRDASLEQQRALLARGPEFAAAFGERESLLAQLESASGRSVYGTQADAAAAEVVRLQAQVDQTNALLADLTSQIAVGQAQMQTFEQALQDTADRRADARSEYETRETVEAIRKAARAGRA